MSAAERDGSAPEDSAPTGEGPGAGDADRVREVARRAVWRITLLEYVLLGAAAVLSVLAGGLAAWALARWGGLPLVPSWIAVAVLVFALPALAVWRRERREDRRLEALREERGESDEAPEENR